MTRKKWQQKKIVIFAEGEFEANQSKTALSLLRYFPTNQIVGVVDSRLDGRKVGDIFPFAKEVPFIPDIERAMELGAEVLVIGVATAGGFLLESWIPQIARAIENNLTIINGLHSFVSEHPKLHPLLSTFKGELVEYRKHEKSFSIATGKILERKTPVRILSVGSDCVMGKMSSLVEIERNLQKQSEYKSRIRFIPTGQTGMMLYNDQGICIDSVISDFIAGSIEEILLDYTDDKLLLIEGQGSIFHPAYSTATIGLMHGCMPHYFIFCHDPSREFIKHTKIPFPDIGYIIDAYESLMGPIIETKTIAIALNTSNMNELDAKNIIDEFEQKYNLPTTDVIRFGPEKIINQILTRI